MRHCPRGSPSPVRRTLRAKREIQVERKDAWAGLNTESPVHRAWEDSQVEFSLLCRTSTDVTGRM